MSLFQQILISMLIILIVPSDNTNDQFILVSRARQVSSATNNQVANQRQSGQTESIVLQNLNNSSRSAPSLLPLAARRRRNNQAAANMRVEVSPIKRTVDESSAATKPATSNMKKRFKTSGKVFASSSRQQIVATTTTGNSTGQELWRQANDTNNNSIVTSKGDDNNNNNNNNYDNNNIVSTSSWNRNVDSINGTIDLSRYERNDIDRLYGDALLVYFKNFNDTLPARRELYSINGTTTASRNKIPIYRSEPTTSEPK